MSCFTKCVFSLFLVISSLYAKQKILILHSYHENLKWTKDINAGINSILEEKYRSAEIFIEYMDTKRYVNEIHYTNIFNIFKYKYSKTKFDLILSSDNNAFNFLKKYNKTLFNSAPVIFNGVNYLQKQDTFGYENFTGINQVYDLEKNYDLIRQVHPNIKNIYTIVDTTTTGKVIKKEIERLYKKNESHNIHYEIIDNVTYNELKQKINTLPQDSAILFTIFYRDKNNDFFEYYEITEMIQKTTNLPVYGISDIHLGHGILGGYLTSGFYHGQESAKMGMEILKGKKAKDIPIQYISPNKYIFDYRELSKYDIDIKVLPRNSLILNKPSSIYELYKYEIIVLSVIFIILILLVIILLINIAKRIKIEKEIQELNAHLEERIHLRTQELEESNDELEQTITYLKNTQEQLIKSEKMASLGGLVAGVAHEINTPVGTSLTGITHFLDITERIKRNYDTADLSEEDFKQYLEISEKLAISINTSLTTTANLIKSFKQISTDQITEKRRNFNIKQYINEILLSLSNIIKKTKIDIHINCDEDIQINSYPSAFYQIISNLIINSIRHGFDDDKEGQIDIKVLKEENVLTIIYTDNGKGILEENMNKIFDPFFTTNRGSGGTGLGLNVIYNIIDFQLNGNITCKSKYGFGVEFKIKMKV